MFCARSILTFLTLLAAAWTSYLSAAPYGPEGMPIEWMQPDGTRLSLRVYGDEFFARTETEDGFTVIYDAADQAYHFAVLSPNGRSLKSSGVRAGVADRPAGITQKIRLPKGVALERALERRQRFVPDEEANWREKVQAVRAFRQVRARRLQNPAFAQGDGVDASPAADPAAAAVTGGQVGLTILVQFPDDTATAESDPLNFPAAHEKMVRYCNELGYSDDGNSGSIRDYFSDQSLGQVDYTQIVAPIVTLPNPRNWYNFSDHPANATLRDSGQTGRLVVQHAIEALQAQGFDFTGLTVNGSNRVIATNVLFAGSTSGVWSEGLWPHRWVVSPQIDVGTGGNNRYIYDYQITNAASSSVPIGTFIHENGHLLLKYPDLYDYGGESEGVGRHGLMGSGNHLNGGRTPAPINAYFKDIVGWGNVTDLTSASFLTTSLPTTGNVAYRYQKPGTPTEYFIVENRGSGDPWAAHSPDKGILIWHIDETVNGNNNEQMTPTQHYEVSVEQADGQFDLENNRDRGDGQDLFDNTTQAFTDSTTPNAHWWDGTSSGIAIEVLSPPGADMSVRFGGLLLDTIEVGAPNGGEAFYTSRMSMITWGANISGNVRIELRKGGAFHSLLSASEANDGSFDWEISESTPSGDDYRIRISSVTTPSIEDFSDGDFTIESAIFFEDFETGSLGSFWQVTGTGTHRTEVSTANDPHDGTYHLAMDSSTSDNYSRNELTLTLDLAGRDSVVLSFRAKEFSDEDNGPPAAPFSGGADFDGVAVSADGTDWYEVQPLRSGTITSAYTQLTVDLDAAISAHGLSYNSGFKIRFNHYDNYPITTDGFVFDNILVTGEIALTAPDLTSASDSGSSDTDEITRNVTPTFTGTATPGTVVSLNSDLEGGTVGSGTANGSGGWSITASTLSEGTHQITATASGKSPSAALSVTIDTTAPNVAIDQASAQGDPATAGPVLFTASFNEPVTGFSTGDVAIGGSAGPATQSVTEAAPNDGTTFQVSVSGLTGEGTVTAAINASVARDIAGNDSTAGNSSDNSVVVVSNLAAPGSVQATDLEFSDKIRVTWDAVATAQIYRVYRNNVNDFGTATLIGSVAGNQFDDTAAGAVPASWFYWVTAEKTVESVTRTSPPGGPDAGQRAADLHGNTSGTASLVSFGGGNTAQSNGTLEAGDVDYFEITLTEPMLLRAYTSGSLDTVGQLFDDASQLLNDPVTDDDAGADENFETRILLRAGTYFLEVSGFSNIQSGAYSVHLELSRALLINEIDADDEGADDREFVELFDGGVGNTDLGGLALVFFDESTDTAYHAIDLDMLSTDGDGYIVAGNNGVGGGPDVFLLDGTLKNGTGAVALYEADAADFPDGTAVTTANLIDAVVYTTDGGADDASLLNLLLPDEPQIDEDDLSNGEGHSLQRLPNWSGRPRSTTSFVAVAPTPGAENAPPGAPSVPDLITANDSGDSDTDNITKVATPTFIGTARPGALVSISAGAADLGTAVADPAGDWNFTVGAALADGPHSITATADKHAGGGVSAGLAITVDTTAPTLTVNRAAGQIDPATVGPVLFTAVFAEEVVGFAGSDVSIGGSAGPTARAVSETAPNDGTTFGISVSGIAQDGTVTASVDAGVAEDLAGNANVASSSADNSVIVVSEQPAPGAVAATDLDFSDQIRVTWNGVNTAQTYDVYRSPTNDFGTATVVGTVVGTQFDDTGAAAQPASWFYWVVAKKTVLGVNRSSAPGGPDTGQRAADQHGNTTVTATGVSFDGGGTAQFGGTLEVGDTDFFEITLAVPMVLRAYTTGSLDTVGSLFDGASQLLNNPATDDDAGSGDNFETEILLRSGTYYLEVSGFGNAQSGTYGVHLELSRAMLINEIDADDADGDDREFVELFDGGAGNITLDGLVLVFFDGTDNLAYHAIDLDGKSTGADGYFVSGNSAVSGGVDDVFADDTLRNGVGAVALYEADATDFPNGTPVTVADLVDAVVYTTDSGPDDVGLLSLLLPAEPQVDEDGAGNGTGHSLQRLPNFTGDPRTTTDFEIFSPTPGSENVLPDAPSIPDLTDGSDSGGSQTDEITNVNLPTFVGTARPGALVTISSDTTDLGTAPADTDGNWSFTAGSALADDTHSITATADKHAGGGVSVGLAVTVDTVAPPVPTDLDLDPGSDSGSDAADDLTNIETPQINGDETQGGVTVTLNSNVDGDVGSVVVSSPWSIVPSALSEGMHQLTARAVDLAGNTSAGSAALPIEIDLTSPGLMIDQSAGQLDPAMAGPFNFSVVFSEAVAGFAANDVAVGGTAGARAVAVTGGSAVFNLLVSGSTREGTVSVAINAGVATDLAGNPSLASVIVDNRVELDQFGGTAATAAGLPFLGTAAASQGSLSPGDVDFFQFTLTKPSQVSVRATGPANTSQTLFSAGGSALSTNVLPAGTYRVRVQGATPADTGLYDVLINIDRFLNLQPDLQIGKKPTALRGANLYDVSAAGQIQKLVSKKLRNVNFHGRLQNDGETVDTLMLRGSNKKKFFKVVYFDGGGNVTAAMVAGIHARALGPGAGDATRIQVKPSRKLKNKRSGRIKRKKFSVFVTATSQLDPNRADGVKAQAKVR